MKKESRTTGFKEFVIDFPDILHCFSITICHYKVCILMHYTLFSFEADNAQLD